MRLTARVEVNMRTAEVAARGAGFAQDFANQMAELAAEYARENVAPGRGPGPHPHRPDWPHEDTGNLSASIQIRAMAMGFLKTAHVFTDLPYGLYLEMGWTNPYTGNHWRYPWLIPALTLAQREWAAIARSTGRRWFSETGAPYRGRQAVQAPLSATWLPEAG